jgi:hypothetical protein
MMKTIGSILLRVLYAVIFAAMLCFGFLSVSFYIRIMTLALVPYEAIFWLCVLIIGFLSCLTNLFFLKKLL